MVSGDLEDFDYKLAMDRLMLLVPFLADSVEDIRRCRETISRAHSIGVMLDPTAYRRGMGNLDDAAEVLNALEPAAGKLRALVDRLKTRRAAQAVAEARP